MENYDGNCSRKRCSSCVRGKYEADLRGKYVIIDKLEDRVDELNDIETSQSIRLAQLEKGIAPYIEKNAELKSMLEEKQKSIKLLQHQITNQIQDHLATHHAVMDRHHHIDLKLQAKRQYMAKIDSLDSGVQKDCNVITMARTLISIRDKGSGSLSELVLTRLTDTDIYNMCEYMDLITLDSDDIVCEKNCSATFFAIVLDGVIKVKHGENKAKWKVIKKSLGYVIGYQQAIEGGLRSCHIAVESEQCKILSMPLYTLDQISVFNPLLAMKIKGLCCLYHS